jgi:hypothetical protein
MAASPFRRVVLALWQLRDDVAGIPHRAQLAAIGAAASGR